MVKTYRLLSRETDRPQATGLLTVELTELSFRYLSFHTDEG